MPTSPSELSAGPGAALPEAALAQRCMEAFEREFWSGRHHRGRLVAEPLRVIRQALPSSAGDDAGALLETLLQTLEAGWPG
ncbi:MAG: hypothetical protein VKM92_09850, partial [Cyanobacteriota bacterium]|nr:hypothetical protein [Cyanobacteriota bacterium]